MMMLAVKMGDPEDWRVDYVTIGGPYIREPATTASAGNERTIARVCASYDENGRTRDFPELQRRCNLISAAPALLAAIMNSDDAHWTPAMRAAMHKALGPLSSGQGTG